MAPNENDRIARSAGFKDAAQALAWQRARQTVMTDPVVAPGQIAPGVGGWFKHQLGQGANAAMALHPKTMFEYINRNLDKAFNK